jgi:hypothetical protein
MMHPLNIKLPDAIANALSAYMSDQQTPAEAIVEAALLGRVLKVLFINASVLKIPLIPLNKGDFERFGSLLIKEG